MEQLELSQIQGFLVSNYFEKPFSNYYLLEIENAENAKSYLKELVGRITSANHQSSNQNLTNIGFTSVASISMIKR